MDNGAPRLKRETFATSRLLEFCSQKELVLQTGHPVEQWSLVILKELVDNAIDACEESGVAPEIKVVVHSGTITIADNGPGIAASTVKSLLDFSVRVSSREAYASPTRGAQGNALKTLVAMPFVLDGALGETTIEARGVRHQIRFTVDGIRQEPRVDRLEGGSDVKVGTIVTVRWPEKTCSLLDQSKSRFLQIAADYAWLNPHLAIQVDWEGAKFYLEATDPKWSKWLPSDPTSAHWYDSERLERLAAAYVAIDQDKKRPPRTVREFVAEFRGLSGTAKQKQVLDATDMARMALADLFINGQPDRKSIAELLKTMQALTRTVPPQQLGVIGKDHIAERFKHAGVNPETFNYKRLLRDDDGIPAVIETAFGYCPDGPPQRRIITGVNWSVGINNPFRQLGDYGQSLDTYLANQRVGYDEPIVLLLHLACPCITYTDRGKSAVTLRGEVSKQTLGDPIVEWDPDSQEADADE
jgi:DNA topoisomerase VI subunit B